jgi:hypothetical protein
MTTTTRTRPDAGVEARNRLGDLAVVLLMALEDLHGVQEEAPRGPIDPDGEETWEQLLRKLRPLAGQLRAALLTVDEIAPDTVRQAVAEAGGAFLLSLCPC